MADNVCAQPTASILPTTCIDIDGKLVRPSLLCPRRRRSDRGRCQAVVFPVYANHRFRYTWKSWIIASNADTVGGLGNYCRTLSAVSDPPLRAPGTVQVSL